MARTCPSCHYVLEREVEGTMACPSCGATMKQGGECLRPFLPTAGRKVVLLAAAYGITAIAVVVAGFVTAGVFSEHFPIPGTPEYQASAFVKDEIANRIDTESVPDSKETDKAAVPVVSDAGNGKTAEFPVVAKSDKATKTNDSVENDRVPAAKNDATLEEEAARQRVKTVLDSWVAGDSLERFRRDHIDIAPPASFRVLSRPKMLRYEIRESKKSMASRGGYEIVVIAIFLKVSGEEVRTTSNCRVYKMAKWHVGPIETL